MVLLRELLSITDDRDYTEVYYLDDDEPAFTGSIPDACEKYKNSDWIVDYFDTAFDVKMYYCKQ